MSTPITTVVIADGQDVVYARQRARHLAGLLGFDETDQTRIATAVSEIARNAFLYSGGGEVTFLLEGESAPQTLSVIVRDQGPGIEHLAPVLDGTYASRTGMGLGIVGVRRLMDRFDIASEPGAGTTVSFGKTLPAAAPFVTASDLERTAAVLLKHRAEDPLEEVRLQNRELLRALEELREHQEELLRLNAELDDTNRGVLALYSELDDKATQLSRANELKARFLSDMSHEFRTPLNSIVSLSRLLLDRVDGDLTAEQQKQVTFIREGAESLTALVDDLLDLARIEAGKTRVRVRTCTVAELFSALRGMLRPTVEGDAVELVFEDVPAEVPALHTDDGKVAQILRNLLSNALKFTEAGEVRVSASLDDAGSAVTFRVADTGIGIAEEDQERIFEEYAQAGRQHSGRKGTGLGLPISRRLAELLGGSLTVRSRPGGGSTFTAVIPVRYTGAAGQAAEDALPEIRVDAARHPVLVVEDDEAAQVLYERLLRESGFQTIPATSVAAARALLESVAPLAIVLDIVMPEGDTWGFLAEVRATPATRDTPVIVASVLEEQDRAFALGVEDYAVKPVAREWLLGALGRIAGRTPVHNVLIVDDDAAARYVLRTHLAGTRYCVLEAQDGEEGLRLASAERPDVVFLDLVMPGMDGFRVLEALKADPATRDIPVVVVTARVLTEGERRELGRDVVAILAKQATSREAALGEVRDALRRAVGARHSGEADGSD